MRPVVLAALLTSSAAWAHFRFLLPDGGSIDMFVTNSTGDPLGGNQKTDPCGVGTQMSDVITTLQAGNTYGVRIDETITHEGHYRVALARSVADIPAPAPDGVDCSARTPPAIKAPVLVDGQLVHTAPFAGPQTIDITVPNMNCSDCRLQVVEYMRSTAPSGCFYFKCARVNVIGASASDGGAGGAGGAGDQRGCACNGGTGGGVVLLLSLGVVLVRGRARLQKSRLHTRSAP